MLFEKDQDVTSIKVKDVNFMVKRKSNDASLEANTKNYLNGVIDRKKI